MWTYRWKYVVEKGIYMVSWEFKIPKRTNLKIVPFCPELHKTLVKFNQNLLIKLFFLDFTISYKIIRHTRHSFKLQVYHASL
jgi:hypothetical protein